MPKIEVKNTAGDKVGTIDLDDAVWGADVNEHLLWECVKWQRAKRRSGTASTKTVAFVRGTNKKPYKQKGTGNARRGTERAHHHVGGGRAYGPKPRVYEYSMPKNAK
jgi:large subunit ribosomal protein L4